MVDINLHDIKIDKILGNPLISYVREEFLECNGFYYLHARFDADNLSINYFSEKYSESLGINPLIDSGEMLENGALAPNAEVF